jgi:hypothetical protein
MRFWHALKAHALKALGCAALRDGVYLLPLSTKHEQALQELAEGVIGGPVALAGFMHRNLVEERQWISDADYKEGLALAQLAPGPLASAASSESRRSRRAD